MSTSFADIRWESDGTPISSQFDDPYFAREGGRAESYEVFIAGNNLPERWAKGADFTIGELGFGTGLNFFETLRQWRAQPRDNQYLNYVAFEKFPLCRADLEAAIAPWPDLFADRDALLSHWPPQETVFKCEIGNVSLKLFIGDANLHLHHWNGRADAWFLDGFSPAKNKDLWGAELMAAVGERTAPGGTFSTFTSAGWVRRNLEEAGFVVRKVPGFGRKRERVCGILSATQT